MLDTRLNGSANDGCTVKLFNTNPVQIFKNSLSTLRSSLTFFLNQSQYTTFNGFLKTVSVHYF